MGNCSLSPSIPGNRPRQGADPKGRTQRAWQDMVEQEVLSLSAGTQGVRRSPGGSREPERPWSRLARGAADWSLPMNSHGGETIHFMIAEASLNGCLLLLVAKGIQLFKQFNKKSLLFLIRFIQNDMYVPVCECI